MFTSYEEVAYGPDVNRIAEQQLLATEPQLLALQIIGMQNGKIASLIASFPFPENATPE